MSLLSLGWGRPSWECSGSFLQALRLLQWEPGAHTSFPSCDFSVRWFSFPHTGIFAYLNYHVPRTRREILETLIKGLQRLEYRGYDSAGTSL